MGLENPTHIAIIVVILLLVFGAKRLPELGRSLGEGMRGFKDSVSGGGSREPEALTPPAPVAPAPAPAPAPPPPAPAATEAPPVPAQAPAPAPDAR
ncbi:MAG: sec-independent protein translocase protein TatA [Solirubrobacteraceae bacterium]|jgi:sec-independent protein translocase protein TatA|nr:sec-independent protein translocase protein TatA [Solirubrobacteraceae bacterium]